jgi:hypothetical protein
MIGESLLLRLYARMFGDLVSPIHYTGLSVIEPQSCASADAGDYCKPTAMETAREFHLPKASHHIGPEESNGA